MAEMGAAPSLAVEAAAEPAAASAADAAVEELAGIREVAERQQRTQALQTALAMARKVGSLESTEQVHLVDHGYKLVERVLMDALRGEATPLPEGGGVSGGSWAINREDAAAFALRLAHYVRGLTGIEPVVEVVPSAAGKGPYAIRL